MIRILQAYLLYSITFSSVSGQDPGPFRDTLSPLNPAVFDTIPRLDTLTIAEEYGDLDRSAAFDTLPRLDTLKTDGEYGNLDLDRSAVFDTIPPGLSGEERTERRARQRNDTLQVRELDPDHSPATAIMYALVLPGLGQGYNGKYFKIPIVYAALGGAGYAINFNVRQYREASRVYAEEQNDFNERYLRYWRRNLELSYISMIVVYALQVVDAYVDAQLYYWDVNENLSMRIVPSIQQMMIPAGTVRPGYGLTCSIGFKRRR